ncbi:hypothetical protein LTR47_009604 [Exophiala xenobiotica]|nr:hypothetical protein LTR41_010930 [Exophiala xenobiotica]KAK5225179.1 hypothetical protein LTR47_009604 [Exophiala xenobiotica]KAK5226709.1 hypothetical protein LTR72_002697 [Exophiala xenobiotica]KAK5243843.1 hypothetical protein LTS06_010469 [Exophiala xenobiotica]KAK5260693.1 hypothetical protein LTR40_003688 [Exophiala xenobiotica]
MDLSTDDNDHLFIAESASHCLDADADADADEPQFNFNFHPPHPQAVAGRARRSTHAQRSFHNTIDMMPRNNRNGNGNGNGNGNNNRNRTGNGNGNGNVNNGNRNNGRHPPPPPPRRQPTQTHDQSQPQTLRDRDQDRDRGGDNVHNVQNVPIKSEQERALLSFHLSTTRSEEKVKIYVGSRNRIFIVPLDSLDKSPVLKALVSRSATVGTGTGTGTLCGNSNSQNNDGVSGLGSGSGSGSSASRLGYSGSKNSGPGSESFIMHPLLTKINPDHFIAVQQFLIMDEYVPAILGNPAGEHVGWPKRLDGHTSVEDYRRESVRAAHLYCLARRLGMRGLARLVVRKIVECGHQESEYRQVDSRGGGGGGGAGGRHPCSGSGVGVGVKCLLDIARVVFSRSLENEAPQGGGGGGGVGWVMDAAVEGKGKGKAKADDDHNEEEKKDVLEEWLIDQLGSKLQTVMTRHAQLFFEIAQHGACESREFQKRVLQRKVEMLEELGNVVLVEDDE